ncbi:MAG TPA: pectinesterase family protein [Polyangiaceae bacterium]|nr:pectinesterase family protein [Polyangiaceae bacterium]
MRNELRSLSLACLLVTVACSGADSGSESRASGGVVGKPPEGSGGGGAGGAGGSPTNASGGRVAGNGGALGSGGEVANGGAMTSVGGRTGAEAGRAGSGGASSSSGGRAALGGAPATSGGTSATPGGASTAGGGAGANRGGAAGASNGGSAGSGGTSTSSVCPPGITQTITVAPSGGQFTSLQAAIDSIPNGSTAHVRIDIRAGKYREKVTIAGRSNLCLVGENAMTTVLTYDDSNGKVGSTSGSASVFVSANDFSAANLTFENSFGSGSQAVALRTTGQRQQFSSCRFVGYQDTLYTHQGLQYFRDCYVQGNTDYVFGGATAILQNCEVRNVEGGSAVAAPNTDSGVRYGIVFLGGRFTAVSSLKANSVALGRPWGADGAAAYLQVNLGAHIASAGFVAMSGNQPEKARFREYESSGPGANASAHPNYEMTATEAAAFTVQTVLGGWTPSYSQ